MTVQCLNDRDKNEIVDRYLAGEAKAELATDYVVSDKTISRVLAERGVLRLNWRSEIRLTPAEAELIKRIREEYLNPEEMIPTRKLTIKDVYHWFKDQCEPYQKSCIQMMQHEIDQKNKQVA